MGRMSRDKEIWKPIAGYEGRYEVSNMGNIKSLPNCRYKTERIKKPYVNHRNGYCYVGLTGEDGRNTQKRVHCLVMNAFCPVPKKDGYDPNYTIDHKDGDKTNNQLSNLEWCTQLENQRRAIKNGLHTFDSLNKKVINLDSGVVYGSVTEAVMSVGGKKPSVISRVCSGERSHYRNVHFAYYDDYVNGTIPVFKGKFKKKSSEGLWL